MDEPKEKPDYDKAMLRFNELMRHANINIYRRVGKIRIAYDQRLTDKHLEDALKIINKMIPRMGDTIEEKHDAILRDCHDMGYQVKDVCDDPLPMNLAKHELTPAWLVERCKRWHFDLVLSDDDNLKMVTHDGWKEELVRKFIPTWFTDYVRTYKTEIITELKNKKEIK